MKQKLVKNKLMIGLIIVIFGLSLVIFGFNSVITNAAPTETTISTGIDVLSISFSNIIPAKGEIFNQVLADQNAFTINSVSFSSERALEAFSGSGSSRFRGSVVLNDIIITKSMDSSSALIQQAISEGTTFDDVHIIHWISSGDQLSKYFDITLTNVIISFYSFASNGELIPTESFGLNYEQIKIEYFNPEGNKNENEFSWNVEEGKTP